MVLFEIWMNKNEKLLNFLSSFYSNDEIVANILLDTSIETFIKFEQEPQLRFHCLKQLFKFLKVCLEVREQKNNLVISIDMPIEPTSLSNTMVSDHGHNVIKVSNLSFMRTNNSDNYYSWKQKTENLGTTFRKNIAQSANKYDVTRSIISYDAISRESPNVGGSKETNHKSELIRKNIKNNLSHCLGAYKNIMYYYLSEVLYHHDDEKKRLDSPFKLNSSQMFSNLPTFLNSLANKTKNQNQSISSTTKNMKCTANSLDFDNGNSTTTPRLKVEWGNVYKNIKTPDINSVIKSREMRKNIIKLQNCFFAHNYFINKSKLLGKNNYSSMTYYRKWVQNPRPCILFFICEVDGQILNSELTFLSCIKPIEVCQDFIQAIECLKKWLIELKSSPILFIHEQVKFFWEFLKEIVNARNQLKKNDSPFTITIIVFGKLEESESRMKQSGVNYYFTDSKDLFKSIANVIF